MNAEVGQYMIKEMLLFRGISQPTKAPKVLVLIFTDLFLNLTYFLWF